MGRSRVIADSGDIGSFRRDMKKLDRRLNTRPKARARLELEKQETLMKENIVRSDAVASTELFRSFERSEYVAETAWGRATRFVLENNAPHAAFVEFGTGDKHVSNQWTEKFQAPKFTMGLVGAIEKWIFEKPSFLTPQPFGTAFGIAKSISRDKGNPPSGTAPQPFFVPVVKSQRPEKSIERTVDRIMRTTF